MKEQSSHTKRRLVSAAVDVFDENGFQKARVSDIVSRAGVAQGTFYLYFKSKEEIFLYICSEFITSFTALLKRAATYLPEAPMKRSGATYMLLSPG